MPQPNDRPSQTSAPILRQPPATRPRRGWPFLLAGILWLLASLACGGSADRVVMLKRLPTLTRTPLPTLTPTPNATQVAMALAAEPVINPTAALAEPTGTPTPLPTYPPAGAGPTPDSQGRAGATLTPLVVLNVRAGPGLEYPVVGKLNQGQSTQIIGQNPDGTWWQIAYPPGSGSPAWVSADPQYANAGNSAGVQLAQAPPPPTQASQEALIAQASTVPPDTSLSADTGTPPPAQTSELTASPTAEPTSAPPITTTSGWAFAGVRMFPDEAEGGLLLFGDLINNTGTLQELTAISGTFYDDQGQVIADGNTSDYWPIAEIPPAGRVPFELFVPDLPGAANFELRVEAEPSDIPAPRQDFEFVGINPSSENGDYCLTGALQNPGDELAGYLAIVAVLFDSQDKVINFFDYYDYSIVELVGDQLTDIEICVDSLNQQVDRYELRAWGS